MNTRVRQLSSGRYVAEAETKFLWFKPKWKGISCGLHLYRVGCRDYIVFCVYNSKQEAEFISLKYNDMKGQGIQDFDNSMTGNDPSQTAPIFTDLSYASNYIKNQLELVASESCGDGYYGESELVQEFTVNSVKYKATLSVEYNRHDKRYYYVEDCEFSVKIKVDF